MNEILSNEIKIQEGKLAGKQNFSRLMKGGCGLNLKIAPSEN